MTWNICTNDNMWFELTLWVVCYVKCDDSESLSAKNGWFTKWILELYIQYISVIKIINKLIQREVLNIENQGIYHKYMWFMPGSEKLHHKIKLFQKCKIIFYMFGIIVICCMVVTFLT